MALNQASTIHPSVGIARNSSYESYLLDLPTDQMCGNFGPIWLQVFKTIFYKNKENKDNTSSSHFFSLF